MRDRFAPSPTGRLHLGHAYSAILGHDAARAAGGSYALRIEDLDAGRCRPEYRAGIEADLAWLGLRFDGAVVVQSAHLARHRAAAARLAGMGLTYACTCTRGEIAAAAPQEGVAAPVYPGTCRGRAPTPGRPVALRLDLGAALAAAGDVLGYAEVGGAWVPGCAETLLREIGDPVLIRRDGAPAYHLAVVVDDAAMGITRVTRGADLAPVTPLHRLVQALLGLAAPEYRHHALIRDAAGRRLAKRDDARALAALRAEGWTPGDVRAHLGV